MAEADTTQTETDNEPKTPETEPETDAKPEKEPETEPEADDGKADKGSEQTSAWKNRARTWEKRAHERDHEIESLKRQIAIRDVADETGVPFDILKNATDADAAKALAKQITDFAGTKTQTKPAYPKDRGGAPAGANPVTKDSIEKIKDPIKRVRARAENIGLYE